LEPIIKTRKDEYMEKISEMKEKRKQLKVKLNEEWDKYKEEN
jgi:uncharacterized coiled-coil DUF342 family protein